ncbi:hypothetical protein ES702_06884 [subsurface metagenome]
MPYGDISSVNDSLTFEPNRALRSHAHWRQHPIYMVAYRGNDFNAWLTTLQIDFYGQISDSIIDSWQFDVTPANHTFPMYIHDDICVIAYLNSSSHTILISFSVNSNGTITKSIIDTCTLDPVGGVPNHIMNLGGGYLAISITGAGGPGDIHTLKVETDGSMPLSPTGSLRIEPSRCVYPELYRVDGDIYAFAYEGPGDDGLLKTVNISKFGLIGPAAIDTYEFDPTGPCHDLTICKTNNYFPITYRGPGHDGFIKVLQIDDDGNITKSIFDTYEFDTTSCHNPDSVRLGQGYFLVVYTGTDLDGFAKTFMTDSNGHLNSTTIDTLEFDTVGGADPDLIRYASSGYAVFYTRDAYYGEVKTFTAQEAPEGKVHHEMLTGIGP